MSLCRFLTGVVCLGSVCYHSPTSPFVPFHPVSFRCPSLLGLFLISSVHVLSFLMRHCILDIPVQHARFFTFFFPFFHGPGAALCISCRTLTSCVLTSIIPPFHSIRSLDFAFSGSHSPFYISYRRSVYYFLAAPRRAAGSYFIYSIIRSMIHSILKPIWLIDPLSV